MADRVEMAVCEACGRVFHPASMRGTLCISCAMKHVAPKKDETPLGFKKVTCLCCGNMFLAPRASTADYCWRCTVSYGPHSKRIRLRKPDGAEFTPDDLVRLGTNHAYLCELLNAAIERGDIVEEGGEK